MLLTEIGYDGVFSVTTDYRFAMWGKMGRSLKVAVFLPWLPLPYAASFWVWFWIARDPDTRVVEFIVFYVFQHLLWFYLFKKREHFSVVVLLFSAATCFVVSRSVAPIYENDFYRYFWDGHQTLSGNSPYAFSPSEMRVPHLEWLRSQVAFPEYRTVYPPVAQLLFAVFTRFSFGSLSLFLWGLILAGTLVCGLGFYRKARESHGRSIALAVTALALQHPLLVKEWYQSCHFDVWLAAIVIWSVGVQEIWKQAGLLILGIGIKIAPLPALLVMFPFSRNQMAKAVLGAGVSLAMILIWSFHDLSDFFQAVTVFGREWEMNSGPFRWVRHFALSMGNSEVVSQNVARGFTLISYLSVLGVIRCYRVKLSGPEKIFWALFFLVFLSPIANPWYFTWFLLLVFFFPDSKRSVVLFLFSFLPLSYAFYLPQEKFLSLENWWDLEYLGMVLCLAYLVVSLNRRQAGHFLTNQKERTIWGYLRRSSQI